MNDSLLHVSDKLKVAYIDYLLSKYGKNIIIGNEIMYGSMGKIADMVILHKNKTYAIEFKSNSDNLNRISEQIQEYKKQFNYVIVISEGKHIAKLTQMLPKDIGLYCISNENEFQILKKPKMQKKLSKYEMLQSINIRHLTKFMVGSNVKTVNEMRTLLAKKNNNYIQSVLFDYWMSKMEKEFRVFLSNRGLNTQIDDLSNFMFNSIL